jgi:cell division septation protein DedD
MITRCLSELLLTHDCVIIPGFGGLVAQPAGASFNAELKALMPPSRTLLFNHQLIINDGLLINYLCRKAKISYAEASRLVMQWTGEIKTSVHSGNRYLMHGIGSFYLNHERKLQFVPDHQSNFMLSSFGLKPVPVMTIAGETTRKSVRKKIPEITQPEKATGLISIAAAIALLIVSALMFPKFEMQLTSLAGLWTKPEEFSSKELNVKPSLATAQTPEQQVTQPATADSERESIADTATSAGESMAEAPVSANQPEQVTPEAEPPAGNYHVIAGCFRMEENAVKLVDKLTASGLQAAIIGKSKSGLSMVSAARFKSAAEANLGLIDLKIWLVDGGWVYHQASE